MAEENTAIIQVQNTTDAKNEDKAVNYIHQRIDELIKKCESCQTDSTYDEIIKWFAYKCCVKWDYVYGYDDFVYDYAKYIWSHLLHSTENI